MARIFVLWKTVHWLVLQINGLAFFRIGTTVMEELNKTIDTNLKFFYIIHSKIKSDNHQVPKIVRVPGNKTNPKKIK